jgi:hypothetical protein
MMSVSTEEFLSEICKKQERIIVLLTYLCWAVTAIAFFLLGARYGWWSFGVNVL